MKAKYAEAIRFGIMAGRQTRFGDVDDPYYRKRSEVIWSYWQNHGLQDLAHRAFKHAAEASRSRSVASMTPEEYVQACKNFELSWTLFTESREEHQFRMLREEVAALRKRVEES